MHSLRTRGAVAVTGALSIAVPLTVAPAYAQEPTEPTPTTETTPAPAPAPAPPPETVPVAPAPAVGTLPGSAPAPRPAPRRKVRLRIGSVTRSVDLGRKVVVRGTLRPGRAGRKVALLVRAGGDWTRVARDRTDKRGRYKLSYSPTSAAALVGRVRFTGDDTAKRAQRGLGRINVFRPALASWYGPGLYGNHLACGGTLSAGTLGVANKSLPCGTLVTLRYGARTVRVPVVDRGPYVGAREFDLTSATKDALGFAGTGTVGSTR